MSTGCSVSDLGTNGVTDLGTSGVTSLRTGCFAHLSTGCSVPDLDTGCVLTSGYQYN